MHMGLSRKHEDLIETILFCLPPLNTTLRFIAFNAQHNEDDSNALSLSSTSLLWVTMAIFMATVTTAGSTHPKVSESGGSAAALATCGSVSEPAHP